jgi:hypothetical protein
MMSRRPTKPIERLPKADEFRDALQGRFKRKHALAIACTVVEVDGSGKARVMFDDDGGTAGDKFFPVFGAAAAVGKKAIAVLVGEQRDDLPPSYAIIIQVST